MCTVDSSSMAAEICVNVTGKEGEVKKPNILRNMERSINRAKRDKVQLEHDIAILSDKRCPLQKSIPIEQCIGCATGEPGHISGIGREVEIVDSKLKIVESRLRRLRAQLRDLTE